MSRYTFKMPDLGEGTVEAEIVAVHIKPGDEVQEEQVILEVMTEKATVEVNSPVSGRVVSIAGGPGQSVSVGSDLIVFDTDANSQAPANDAAPDAQSTAEPAQRNGAAHSETPNHSNPVANTNGRENGNGRIMASPATRRRAKEAGVELAAVPGSGPHGRIERGDLDRFLATRGRTPTAKPSRPATTEARNEVDEVPIIGLRRLIAQRMSEAVRTIPHFSYVEEIDVTELEALRAHLNARDDRTQLTYLPFLALALVRVLPRFPQCNARYDSQREVLLQHRAVHLGIATQTPGGLKVPVVRNAEQRSLHDVAAEIRRVTTAARDNKAAKEELTGSTITLTSLGKLGGIASTPIINAPEVAILGVNKAVDRPVVKKGAVIVRRMMNLSGSFDHRFVDGHDAASLVQALKEAVEHPALIFADLGR